MAFLGDPSAKHAWAGMTGAAEVTGRETFCLATTRSILSNSGCRFLCLLSGSCVAVPLLRTWRVDNGDADLGDTGGGLAITHSLIPSSQR
ncbi:uncharacterized protein PgNI_09989 [Pyricularia grisea]|uniref:Uncharacterized protein n=1 Tax=Pyricularia grisea TaxID=148305 RepID=A0A6P8ARI3_PYRGI|nr:uncharacterized protein PgNI_09989 [Pyricularia grisea]TLD04715.1 hypothetical protein PgNI_09989 [Pyricularia grisea]